MTGDLIVLTADKSMRKVVEVLLSERHRALGLDCPIQFKLLEHPQHDDGCLLGAGRMLAAFTRQFRYCMVLFDHQGCGRDREEPENLESQVEQQLHDAGWEHRCAVMVIAPELENWIWSESPHVARALGWNGDGETLWAWLAAEGFIGKPKPTKPKEALQRVLRKTRKGFSASIHAEIATKASLSACTDRAFIKFRQCLQDWFE